MNRLGSSTGKGAGWPTERADSGWMSHTDSVDSKKASRSIVFLPLRTRWKRPFEKQRQYSWTSRKIGLLADSHEPHAVELLAAPISMLLLLLLLYRFLPARHLTWRSQLPGALLGTAGIEILKRGFAFWASHSTGIGALPRSFLSVVILLIWFGFFAQIVLYGAALNVVLAEKKVVVA